MTVFNELAFFTRSMFGLWAFMLCCLGIIGCILSFAFRRYRYILLSLAVFAPAYFLWQMVFNIYRVMNDSDVITAPVCARMGGLPWIVWVAAFVPVTLAASLSIYMNIRYSRTYITPLSIKTCGDRMNCGFCYWLDSGRVVFSNICMNRLSMAITGEPLLNGNTFRDSITDSIRPIGDEVWSFTCRDIEFDGGLLHEMVAEDVTEIHAKTEELRKSNKELSVMMNELKAYTLKIDDVVRRQEILQAKIDIHEEMNRLMLSTIAADRDDSEALDRIFTQWQQNALLLCMEAGTKAEQNADDGLESLAELLGITLQRKGTLPNVLTEKQRELFYTAAQEAIVNAVKHGEAENLEISFEKSTDGIRCTFENDGNIPKEAIRFTGGLANLLTVAREQGAVLSADTGETFRLSLLFPEKS